MNHNCYSSLKVFHHRQSIDSLRAGRRPTLLHVHLVPTNRCNHSCRFCAYRSQGYSSSHGFRAHEEIPYSRLVEIVADCRRLGVKAVELTGGGEPTMHGSFASLCRMLRDHAIEYSVVTNGSQLDEDAMVALAGAKWVRFSVDAGCSATYAAIRRVKPELFDRVRSNLRAFVVSRNAREPVVGVSFVVTRGNWREVAQAAANAREDGADNFRISAVFQNEGADYFREFYEQARGLCRQAGAMGDGRFAVFDLFSDRIQDLQQESPSDSTCHLQHLVTYIGADLNVYRCCVLAYNRHGLLGSLKDQSFYDLWSSGDTASRLRGFDARQCPRCMYNAKNQIIKYAVESDPLHVNFL